MERRSTAPENSSCSLGELPAASATAPLTKDAIATAAAGRTARGTRAETDDARRGSRGARGQYREVERRPAPDGIHDQVERVAQPAGENEKLLRGCRPMRCRARQRLRPKLTGTRLQGLTGSGQLHGDFVEHVRNVPIPARRLKRAPRREPLGRFDDLTRFLDQPRGLVDDLPGATEAGTPGAAPALRSRRVARRHPRPPRISRVFIRGGPIACVRHSFFLNAIRCAPEPIGNTDFVNLSLRTDWRI